MNDSLDLFASLSAGSQPVETSEHAADLQTPERLAKLRRQVLAFIVSQGARGATADEVEAHFNLGHNSTSPRVTELHTMGMIGRYDGKEWSPKWKRPTRQGGTAFVYEATAMGRAQIAVPLAS